MVNIISHSCPRCNSHSLYKYGKDKFGNQKYQCRKCKHQFAPDFVSSGSRGVKPLPPEQRKYPSCPVCGKSAFLHHDYDDYSNYRCSDKKCNHSFFQATLPIFIIFNHIPKPLSLYLNMAFITTVYFLKYTLFRFPQNNNRHSKLSPVQSSIHTAP